MKTLLSTKYSDAAFNTGMLILRIFLGLVLMSHGYAKLIKFTSLRHHFLNFFHMGSTLSLSLIIFAELFCGFLIVLGMFTRLASIPIVIGMGVVFFIASNSDLFGAGERGAIYMAAAFMILLCGPGRISMDAILGK